jgi:CRP/FNR family transcriptional regulator, cyclic AMP receptor protein
MAPHRGRPRGMSDHGSHVRLLEADPDIGRYLTEDERIEASTLTVPTVDLEQGPVDISGLLERTWCFGAFVLEGLLAVNLRVGEQAGMRVLGPGDVVSAGAFPASMLLVDWSCRAAAPTRLAMLGKDILVGAHRWPRLIAGLHARTGEQIERVAVQLAICQLPRVEDRLLALFWLLAEQWGRVTPHGTVLPLALTHETLGALVGARRPTITLALGELANRGAVVRQGRAWLLAEQPPLATRTAGDPHAPALVVDSPSLWGVREADSADTQHAEHDEMIATVERLRLQHERTTETIRAGMTRVRESRLRSQELRERIRAQRELSSRQAPSSR